MSNASDYEGSGGSGSTTPRGGRPVSLPPSTLATGGGLSPISTSKMLHDAAATGNVEVLGVLIKKNKNVNRRGPGDATPLHLAAFHNHPEAVRLLISANASVSATDQDGSTPLQNAAYNGAVDCVRLLLKAGADVNSRDNDGSTPLHKAAFSGRLECVRYLLRKGADINAEDDGGATALHHACANGLDEIVSMLLKKNARDSICETTNDATPLHRAVTGGNLKCVQLLLDSGVDINCRDKHGSAPLHLACEFGYMDITSELVTRGANINALDLSGSSPLHVCSFRGFSGLTALLCKSGADVNVGELAEEGASSSQTQRRPSRRKVRQQMGHTDDVEVQATPIHHAAFSGHVECVLALLDHGAHINATDQDGATALHKAAFQGHSQVVELLMEKGCNVDIADNEGASALHKASYSGKDDVIKTLLRSANLTQKDNDEGLPLHNAAYMGHIACAQLLLDAGCDIDAPTRTGATALHMAASRGQPEMVVFLMDRGARVDIANEKGMTPLHVAVKNLACVQALAKKGADLRMEDKRGYTALYYAAAKDCEDTVEWLVHNGCDPKRIASDGSSLLTVSTHIPRAQLEEIMVQWSTARELQTKKEWETAVREFNRKPRKGIEYLVANKLIENTPADIARFLHRADDLSKKKIGEMLGENDEHTLAVLDAFVDHFDFTQNGLDMALRRFLLTFRLPGEAQKIDRLMERFARQFCLNNPNVFPHEDTAYLLAFSLIMLNTDAHNPAIKKENKMTFAQFKNTLKGIPGSSGLPETLFHDLYYSIIENEIKMETNGTVFYNVEKKGWMVKQGGRIKTWKTRWFVLSGNTLYYFKKHVRIS
eukprot:TRINITY_DN3138_c0_g1_i2.p1 TRINITY_DN3138_c0_g1~~TRINITY_DN3138_c0_g1_i2.p1  ORF type:complete len:830 (-),score=195.56 TRINITY_DN3138_c0_g1_i2:127-2616(-)